ncbi:MAG: MerR family transcriptional regulator [Planctomycetota bacterium]|jgi:MerR family transcriptional regulator/heat shock protein HspR
MPDSNPQHGVNDPLISIGVLAQQVGLSVSAVRKYENDGLILAHRTDSGHRLFSYEDIGRVQSIQHLIQDLGLNTEGIRRMQALLPCWDLLPCSAETRRSCPAYQDTTRPCWTIKGLDCVAQGNECRQCVVYRFGSLCTEDIKHLLRNGDDSRDACAAMQELMQRRRHSKERDS